MPLVAMNFRFFADQLLALHHPRHAGGGVLVDRDPDPVGLRDRQGRRR
jgi:hypothetical protein